MNLKIATALKCILAVGIGAWSQASPRIDLSESEINLGRIHSGRPMHHIVTIGNVGSEDLKVHRIRACCGTAVNPSDGMTVKPGEELPLEIVFHVPPRAGRHVRRIDIDSDCPDRPRVGLRLFFQAVAVADIDPQYIFFERLDRNETAGIVGEITTQEGVRIEGISVSSESYRAELDTIEPGHIYRFKVFTNPPLDFGSHSAIVSLNADRGLRFDVPVFATVMGPLNYAPTEMVLPRGIEDRLTRHIIVRAGTVAGFEIADVECPTREMTAEVAPFGGDGYRVTITNIIPQEGLDGREILIRTDAEGMEEITVPIRMLK